jgi:hypothetical protein
MWWKERTMGDALGSNSNVDQMVSLVVPRRFYPAVLQALADLYRTESSGQNETNSAVTQAELEEHSYWGWTRQDVELLKQLVHNPTIRALFDLARECDECFVSIRALEQFTGRRFGQVRADFAGLTRMTRKRFGRDGKWPFEAVWAADGKPQMSYRVPAEVLSWWHEG